MRLIYHKQLCPETKFTSTLIGFAPTKWLQFWRLHFPINILMDVIKSVFIFRRNIPQNIDLQKVIISSGRAIVWHKHQNITWASDYPVDSNTLSFYLCTSPGHTVFTTDQYFITSSSTTYICRKVWQRVDLHTSLINDFASIGFKRAHAWHANYFGHRLTVKSLI